MMTKSNFEFLKGVNDFTYAIACAAENNGDAANLLI